MVSIYGMGTCALCKKAVELCERFDLEHEYKDIMVNYQNSVEFTEKFPNAKIVPQIMWDGQHFNTFREFEEEVHNTKNV